MATQPTDKAGRKVRFIRKNGRVIPIHADGPSRGHRAVLGVGGGYVGAGIGKKIATKGHQNARGVVTMFHGTDRASGQAIRKSAIRAKVGKQTFEGGVAQTGLAFASTDKKSTIGFSRLAEAKAKRGKAWNIGNAEDAFERMKAGAFGEKGDVIKFEVSKKTFARKFMEDPENALLRGKGINTKSNAAISSRFASKTNISSKRIIDGQGIRKTLGRHVMQAVKTFKGDKKSFAIGAAQIIGGAALVAGSAAAIYWGMGGRFGKSTRKKPPTKSSPE